MPDNGTASQPGAIFSMSNDDSGRIDINSLETRVDELIGTIQSLETENSSLRTQHSDLMAERAELIEKTEQARSRVEAIITRLKAMEIRP